MSALGIPDDVDRNETLNASQFYLPLGDSLICKTHPHSSHLKELADSFCYDVLNLAALAARLLWYEGVTPEIWRSHDLITVGVDTESYFVMLQSACDIMADVIVTLGQTKKGQAPWESFHRLNEWSIKNPKRLQPEYQLLIGQQMEWFRQINGVRTKLVHRGGHVWVYTQRVSFEWDVHVSGSGVSRGQYLLSSLKTLTRTMLDFSDQLAEVIMPAKARQEHAQKRIIDGVYVPALHHLLRYNLPQKSDSLPVVARCLLTCGGYVEASFVGYPDGFWWLLIVALAERMDKGLVATNIKVGASGAVHDCKFVFSDGKKQNGVIACDNGRVSDNWLEGAAQSASMFQADYGLKNVVLVIRNMVGDAGDFLPDTDFPIVVGNDAETVKSKMFTLI